MRFGKSEQECLPGNLRRKENGENATIERHPFFHMENGLADVGNRPLIRSYLQRVAIAESQKLATLAADEQQQIASASSVMNGVNDPTTTTFPCPSLPRAEFLWRHRCTPITRTAAT